MLYNNFYILNIYTMPWWWAWWNTFDSRKSLPEDFIPITGIDKKWWPNQKKGKTIIAKEIEWRKWEFQKNRFFKTFKEVTITVWIILWAWYIWSKLLDISNKENKTQLQIYTTLHDDFQNLDNQLNSWKPTSVEYIQNFTNKLHQVTNSDLNFEQKELLKKEIEQIKTNHPELFDVK